jgi:hypothetical protein
MGFFSKLAAINLDAVLTGLLGALVLLYAGAFRAIGQVISRITTPIAIGYWFYWRSSNPNKINVTLNILTDQHLDIDTIVADRLLTDIYKNHFIAQMVKLAAKRTTPEDPVVHFPPPRQGRRLFKLAYKTERHLYEAVYNPLISEVSEKTNNIFSFMAAVGFPMREFRFVLALTYEKGIPDRDQHFRCMMVSEEALKRLPKECPPVDHGTYRTRFRTLACIAAQYAVRPEHFGVIKLWVPEVWADQVSRGALPVPPAVDKT